MGAKGDARGNAAKEGRGKDAAREVAQGDAVTHPAKAPEAPEVALARLVGARLGARQLKFAAAESCTGGMLACAMTEIAGSSGWFERGFVTYSNEAKSELLGVDAHLIERFGAVSEPVAGAMAAGALAHSRADVAVSITGIAGPGGAVSGKPVGTVSFGLAARSGAHHVETRHFSGDRHAVRRAATAHALRAVLQWLEEDAP